MLLVGDVDLGGEGLFLGGALEADAVREFVVDPAVLRIGLHLLPVHQHAQALFIERGAGSDRIERDRTKKKESGCKYYNLASQLDGIRRCRLCSIVSAHTKPTESDFK